METYLETYLEKVEGMSMNVATPSSATTTTTTTPRYQGKIKETY